MVLAGGTMEPIEEFNTLIDEIGQKNYFRFQANHKIEP
jgi:hypothetical protein